LRSALTDIVEQVEEVESAVRALPDFRVEVDGKVHDGAALKLEIQDCFDAVRNWERRSRTVVDGLEAIQAEVLAPVSDSVGRGSRATFLMGIAAMVLSIAILVVDRFVLPTTVDATLERVELLQNDALLELEGTAQKMEEQTDILIDSIAILRADTLSEVKTAKTAIVEELSSATVERCADPQRRVAISEVGYSVHPEETGHLVGPFTPRSVTRTADGHYLDGQVLLVDRLSDQCAGKPLKFSLRVQGNSEDFSFAHVPSKTTPESVEFGGGVISQKVGWSFGAIPNDGVHRMDISAVVSDRQFPLYAEDFEVKAAQVAQKPTVKGP